MAGMLTRRNTDPNYPGVLAPEQAISLSDALPIFTTNGARSLGMQGETGSLSTGKWADFITLKDNITKISPVEIAAVSPLTTVWKGKIVHAR